MAYSLSSSFTRPHDTTAYTSGDLIANSTTAASVVPLSWTFNHVNGDVFIRRIKIFGTKTADVTNKSIRLHLYLANPTATAPTNGDNGAWATILASHIGYFDSTNAILFNDGSWQSAVPEAGVDLILPLTDGDIVYGLLEARAAYTPGDQEVFTVVLESYAVYSK